MQSTDTQQDYGSNPLSVRDTNHYKNEYIKTFVEKWDDLIDWEGRASAEGDFFIRLLREHGKHKVLDVATGTGFHSVRLLQAGFEVTSADGSEEMLSKAFDNARQRGYILRTVHADWRYLNRDVHDLYDAVICLGNSFTHLHDENDRRKALAEFYATLRHDGILIIDQRNYDALLDHSVEPSHSYYYCGEDVSASPEHVDDSLARFRYTFADGSSYHLNMFPLRQNYTRRLLQEVGFQRVTTYGDFQETYRASDPDFLIHVAEKAYVEGEEGDSGYSEVVETARSYYNSNDADNFYFHIWGGEDIHVGLYESEDDSIRDASERTVELMAKQLGNLDTTTRVIDVGAGYGGAARWLARNYQAHTTCVNLSEAQNERNRQLSHEQGLDSYIEVLDASFENIPCRASTFHIAWSQDAILHSGDRERVLDEIDRVLKPGGEVVMTDPMQADDCPPGVLDPVLQRIHLDSLGSFAFYRQQAERLGWEELKVIDLSEQLVNHYSRVRKELLGRRQELSDKVSEEYVTRMLEGLKHWVEAGTNGYLAWGIMHFRKPANS